MKSWSNVFITHPVRPDPDEMLTRRDLWLPPAAQYHGISQVLIIEDISLSEQFWEHRPEEGGRRGGRSGRILIIIDDLLT